MTAIIAGKDVDWDVCIVVWMFRQDPEREDIELIRIVPQAIQTQMDEIQDEFERLILGPVDSSAQFQAFQVPEADLVQEWVRMQNEGIHEFFPVNDWAPWAAVWNKVQDVFEVPIPY